MQLMNLICDGLTATICTQIICDPAQQVKERFDHAHTREFYPSKSREFII